MRIANTRELPNAAYALLLPAYGLHFISVSPDIEVFEARMVT